MISNKAQGRVILKAILAAVLVMGLCWLAGLATWNYVVRERPTAVIEPTDLALSSSNVLVLDPSGGPQRNTPLSLSDPSPVQPYTVNMYGNYKYVLRCATEGYRLVRGSDETSEWMECQKVEHEAGK